MHSFNPRDYALAIEIPSIFRRRTIAFTPDYVTDGHRKIYYKDATKTSYSAVRHSVNFIPLYQHYSFMVGSADQEIRIWMGTALYLGNARREKIWQKLASSASHAIQPHIVETLMRRIFVNFEAVRVGNLELTREGYSRGKLFGGREHILWTEAKHVPILNAGVVNVWKNDNGRRVLFAMIPTSISNAVVLPELMKACANAAVIAKSSETRRGSDDVHYIEISFLDAIRGANKTVYFLGPHPVEINVPPGVASGYTVRIPGRGAHRGDGVRADALIEIKVTPHPRFERRGLDICLDVWASAHDLASGATIEVPTLDGYAKVRIPKGAVSGQILRLWGNGILCAKSGSIGHQLVRIMAREESAQRDTADPWQTTNTEQTAGSGQTAENRKAKLQPDGARTDDAIETEFNTVFFTRTSADRARIISYWMQKKNVHRAEAMKLAIEDWRKDTRAGR